MGAEPNKLKPRKELYNELYSYFKYDHDDTLKADTIGDNESEVTDVKWNFLDKARELGMEKKEVSEGGSRILGRGKDSIDPLWREKKQEQEKVDYQAKIKKGYDDFYARHNDPRPLSSRRRKLHTRNSGLRKAKKLRRMGFTRAAEKAAMDWSDSTESDRSAISTPAMREQENADHRQQRRNQGVIDRLIQRLDQ